MTIHDVVFVYHLRERHLLNWHSRVHSHPEGYFEIHYFLSGKGGFKNGGTVFGLEKGRLFLSAADQVHAVQPGSIEDPLTYYAVLFEPGAGPEEDEIRRALASPLFASALPLQVGDDYRLRFEALKNRYNSPLEYYRASARHDLAALVFELCGRHTERSGGAPAWPDQAAVSEANSDIYVGQAMDLFQKQVFSKLRLASVASLLKISEEYLIKIFRRKIGVTPMKYFQNLKLEASISLLLNSTRSLKEIAFDLGFSSQYHFSRSFKAFAGLSPSEYRLRYFQDNPNQYHTKIIGN